MRVPHRIGPGVPSYPRQAPWSLCTKEPTDPGGGPVTKLIEPCNTSTIVEDNHRVKVEGWLRPPSHPRPLPVRNVELSLGGHSGPANATQRPGRSRSRL